MMSFDTHMGEQYPFTLEEKLKVITEPSPWYTAEGGGRVSLGARHHPG